MLCVVSVRSSVWRKVVLLNMVTGLEKLIDPPTAALRVSMSSRMKRFAATHGVLCCRCRCPGKVDGCERQEGSVSSVKANNTVKQWWHPTE